MNSFDCRNAFSGHFRSGACAVVNVRLTYGKPRRLFDGCRVVDDGRRDHGPDGQGQLGTGR